MYEDEVAEWLRRWTANPMGSARVGSNPILVEAFLDFFVILNTLVVNYRWLLHRRTYCQQILEKKEFRYRESNPGLLGESQLS